MVPRDRCRAFRSPRFRFARFPLPLLGLLTLVTAPRLEAGRGRWTPELAEMGGKAIHLILLPGTGTHSRILWWDDFGLGRVLGWNPANGDCDDNAATLEGFTVLAGGDPGTTEPWAPGANVFCSGHSPLSSPEAPSGRFMTVGGKGDKLDWGLRDARMYTAGTGTGTWTATAAPRWPRWYPQVTALSDGRILTSGGSKGEQFWYWGGRRDESPPTGGSGDDLHRFGRVSDPGGPASGGYWEDPVTPLPAGGVPPLAREGHVGAFLLNENGQAIFGGRDGSGNLIDDGARVWLLKRTNGGPLAAEYTYQWEQLTVGQTRPDPRTEHAAVAISNDTEILVLGGIWKPQGQGEAPTDELWRLHKVAGAWSWQQLSLPSGPSPRYGHAAVYDMVGSRVLVFGGAEALSGHPSDNRVWALNLATNPWTWEELPTTGGIPARRDHIMVLDPDSPSGSRSLLVYGGHLGAGQSDETLWRLDLSASPPAWSPVAVGGSPGTRAGHVAFYDNRFNAGRLFVHGGDPTGSGPYDLDDYHHVWVIDPFPAGGGTPQWRRWQQTSFRLSQHTVSPDRTGTSNPVLTARIPEIYTPSTDSWAAVPEAAWLQDWNFYPVQFVVPGTERPGGGGRVVTVGPDPQARYLDIPPPGQPAGGWLNVGTSGSTLFGMHTGVLYRPDKIMVAGTSPGADPYATTKRLDTSNFAAGWTSCQCPGEAQLARRYRHNLVLLPTGDVMAVGGMRFSGIQFSDTSDAQPCPQIWSPATDSWTPLYDLECDEVLENGVLRNVVRNYHSSATLLPCGRVLSASGHDHGDATTARIFCPPYLFKNDNTSAETLRPQISGAPTHLTYRKTFTVCTPDPAAITRVRLIRPGATTHGFDTNQRYVPLDFTVAEGGPPRLFVAAPASPDSAPPGDYLLFLTGAWDNEPQPPTHYEDLPSIARWVRLEPGGADLCDAVQPGAVTDFAPDAVGETEVWLSWTGPGDDDGLGPSGPPTAFDLRSSTNESQPGPAGSPGSGSVAGLQPCSWNLFTVSAWDDNQQESAPVTTSVQTLCGGGGGSGGFGAAPAGGEEGGGIPGAEIGAAGAETLEPASGLLIVESRRTREGGWQVSVRLSNTAEGAEAAEAEAVLVQRRVASGEWHTVARHLPRATTSLLGLSMLRDQGRLVVPARYRLERLKTDLRSGGQGYALLSVQHSRLGDLGPTPALGGGGATWAVGDSLTLTYGHSDAPALEAAGWYLSVRRVEGASASPASGRRARVELPPRFALHQNQPNPFAGSTRVTFDLPVESPVQIHVYDLLGRRVATLADGIYRAGFHTVDWDLRGAGGVMVRPGVYVCRMRAGAFQAERKMSALP